MTSHFPPDRSAGTHRVLRLANYLQAHGWATSILTLDPGCYRRSIQLDDTLIHRADPRLTIVRTGAVRGLTALIRWRHTVKGNERPTQSANGGPQTSRSHQGFKAWRRRTASRLFAFPDDEIGWFAPAVLRGLRIVRQQRIQVVLSSAPPFTCHLIGHALRSLSNVRWIADFRDPWARTRWGALDGARVHQSLEARVIKRADAVVLNTPELHREFAEWYGSDISSRFHVVANGYDADILEPYIYATPSAPPPVILTHAGNLYGARNPTPLLQGLAKCLGDGEVPRDGLRLNFVGKIASDFKIDSVIARLGLGDSVTQTPPVPHNESLRLLAASHVLVVVQPHTRVQVPAKLYEYVGLRRPILALAEEGAVARVVRDSDFGIVVSPTSIDGIAAALNELYRRHARLVQPGVCNPRAAQYDARHQSAILGEILAGFAPGLAARVSPVSG